MKRILIISIIVVLMLVCIMSACTPIEEWENYIEEDGWRALQYGDTARLIGMKGDLLEKEELVVPKTVNGISIDVISSLKYTSYFTNSQGELIYKAKKIFLPNDYYQFMTNENKKHDFPVAGKIILISIDITQIGGLKLKYGVGKYSYPYCFESSNLYVPKNSLETYINRYGEWNPNTKFYAANMSYYYNYDDAPNDGYYWVDDINLGDKVKTIPDNPQREGYEFCGWYEEDECIHEVELSEFVKGEEEIELFAKWIKTEESI